ncbi:hypothetical protein [Pseudomonas brassicacearum]|uniref:hypothetical protein n=1 Tax=Pseudomonas brassicacearum TaxID=930166 RepID=UPI001BDE8354|nr:hypothetical protein [Pseudomonas brassicacearum]
MLTQPKKAPAPLALRAPEIPGRTEQDLPSGEWGLNFAAVQGNFPDKGLKVHILDWTQMGIGDNVKLLLDGDEVDQHTITDLTEVGERVTLWVPPRRFLTGSHELTYVVKRPSQSNETYTPPVKLYVKLELPGGQDLDPDPGSHSELYMYIDPAIVEDGVDQEAAENGVDITVQAKPDSSTSEPYPYIAVGDVITLSWGGVLVESDPVEQAQIDDPDNNPIVIHVSKEIIVEAGDSGPDGLAVTFQIHDLVKNQSEDWCPETRLVVDTGNSRLVAPILEQADGNVLNLDTLGDEALQLQVWAEIQDGFLKGDVIIMRVKGITLDGDLIEETARQEIEENPPTVVRVYMPNGSARALAKTQAVFSYKQERGGMVIQQSKGRFVNIIGEPTQLAAPIADDAQSGALDPDLASTRIRIPFDDVITADMAIELKWFGTRADQSSYEPELDWYFPSEGEIGAKEDFFITVEGRHLKTLEGGTLDLSYNLLSDENGDIVRRGSRHAVLLNVGEPRFELAPPIVLGEQDGALEPADLPNGTSKVTCPNPVTNPTKRQDVVHWELRDAQGVQLAEDSKTLNALSEGKAVEFPLSAAFVQEHFEAHRGEELTVRYDILRFETGKTSHSNPLEFVVGTALAPTILSVKGQPSNVEIPNGGNTVETSVILSGTATAGMSVEIFEGTVSKGSFVATGGTWTSTAIAVAAGARSFTAKAKYGAEPVSDARTLTVVAALKPVISSVKGQPSNAEIPNGGNTVETSVTLSGTATAGMSVEIFEGDVSKGTFVATGGTWTTTAIAVAVGERSFTAKAKYGAEPVSDARTFRVSDSPPLIVDPTTMLLDGIKFFQSYGLAQREAPNNTGTRTPTGGVSPYRYTSLDPQTASVSDEGKVTGLRNGETTIVVEDSVGAVRRYPVVVQNIYRLLRREGPTTAADVHAWAREIGWTPTRPMRELISALADNFRTLEGLLETVAGPAPSDTFTGVAHLWNSGTTIYISGYLWSSNVPGFISYLDGSTRLFPRMLAFEPINS